VLKQTFKEGIRIPTEKKDTSACLVKISPHLGGLRPEYVKGPVRSKPGYLSKLERLDRIERNYNLD